MNKKIRVIDLLNKIANGEEVPEQIRYDDTIYYRSNFNLGDSTWFFDKKPGYGGNPLVSNLNLNDEVETIEEQPKIDIQAIEELEPENSGGITVISDEKYTINQLVKAVKQLDRQIGKKK